MTPTATGRSATPSPTPPHGAAGGAPAAMGWPRILWVTGTVLLVTMVVHIAALLVSGGPWTGPVSLRKPATFAETGWLVCWSVALILPVVRTRVWQRHLVGVATVLFGVGETAIMAFQAWRGVPSHYNFTTPLDAALMRGGAAGTAGIFLVATVVLLVAVARSTASPSGLRLGVLAGIALLFAGCAIGLVMIFNNSGVYQGSIGEGFTDRTSGYLGPSPATVGPDYLVIKPATAGGDLVLMHAIGVHGLVLLAVPAVLLARTAMPAARQLRVVALAVAAVGAAMSILAGHAFRQLPWNQLPPPALAALALCTVTLLAGYGVIAAAVARSRSRG